MRQFSHSVSKQPIAIYVNLFYKKDIHKRQMKKLLITASFPLPPAPQNNQLHYLPILLRFETSFTSLLLLKSEVFEQKCDMDLHQKQYLHNKAKIKHSPSWIQTFCSLKTSLTLRQLKIDTFNLMCCCSCAPSKSKWKSNILQHQLEGTGEYTALCVLWRCWFRLQTRLPGLITLPLVTSRFYMDDRNKPCAASHTEG